MIVSERAKFYIVEAAYPASFPATGVTEYLNSSLDWYITALCVELVSACRDRVR